MKTQWEIPIQSDTQEHVAITYGDPANALQAVDDYALKPLPEAIENWETIMPLLTKDHWYDITAFYSRRKMDLSKKEAQLLFDYNQKAFDAAKEKGGLVLYYQGVLLSRDNLSTNPNLQLSFIPNCLSFCIWNSLPEAKAGAQIPAHKKATQMTALWFDGFTIVKYQVMLKEFSEKKTLVFKKKLHN